MRRYKRGYTGESGRMDYRRGALEVLKAECEVRRGRPIPY
jgi:hypothetical protein